MNTPTHFLMTAALRKALPSLRMRRSAVLLGSLAPDLPLYALSFGGLFYFTWFEGRTLRESAEHIFGTLYFEDPIWISLHNCLHSPFTLLLSISIVAFWAKLGAKWIDWVRWFLIACLLHSVVDIFTHYDDGPLLLWPLEWNWRFRSPISYWDHRHFGSEVARGEFLFNVLMVIYLIAPWVHHRLRKSLGMAPKVPEHGQHDKPDP